MAFEAVTKVSEAEAAAKKTVAEAEIKAKQMLGDAEEDGRAVVNAAVAKAEAAVEQLRIHTGQKNAETEKRINAELEDTKAALRAQAEERLLQAAELIVERIVKS